MSMNASLVPSLTLICVRGAGNPASIKEQAQTRFLRRLRPAVHKCKRCAGAPDPAGASIPVSQFDYFTNRHTRRGSQRVQVGHRDIAWQMAGDVQRRAGRSRDGQLRRCR